MDDLLIDGFVLLDLDLLGHRRLVIHLPRLVSSACRSSGSVVVLSDSKRVLLAGQPTSADLIITFGVRSILFL